MFGDKEFGIKFNSDTNDEFENAIEKGVKINKYLSEKKELILEIINTCKRTLIHANPDTGKTTFFADLCVDHSSKKSKGRIIFCSPFIIIQEQFKARLKSKNVNIDFELNHKNKRKKILDSDKIITSTFKSLHLIAQEFDSNDLIIVDESHTLLHSYGHYSNSKERTFYIEIIKVLYNTTSKVVLMSGTPHMGIKSFLGLVELKVFKNNVESKINIEYNSEKKVDIVLEFAKRNLKKYGSDFLNIIYIKNRSKCYVFKEILEEQLNVKTLVLTSEEKDTIDYKQLINKSTINKNIQFLITTNVISTGANILNKNIGSALMFDEFNPSEIKQFSKRFRNKLDINVDVINPTYTKYIENESSIEALTKRRDSQLGLLKVLIEQINSTYQKSNELLQYDNSFYNSYEGSVEQIKDKLIERYLIQEVYFQEKLNQFNRDPNKLTQLLNKYDDIMTVNVNNPYKKNISINYDKSAIENKIELKLDKLFVDFIFNTEMYLCGLYQYLKSNERFLSYRFENLFDFFDYQYQETQTKIINQFKQPTIKENLILPLLEFKPFISDIEKLLYFIKSTKKNKRQPLKISLYFNKKFSEYFKPISSAIDFHGNFSNGQFDGLWQKTPELVTNPSSKKTININDTVNRKLIMHTFYYLLKNDIVNYKDFKAYLLEKEIKVNPKSIKKLEFPLGLITFNNTTGIITDIKLNLIIGLIRSIYRIESKQTYKRSNEGRKSCYKLITKAFDLDKIKTLSESQYQFARKHLYTTQPTDYNVRTYKHDYVNLNKSSRVRTNQAVLLHDNLDNDYYKLIDKKNADLSIQ